MTAVAAAVALAACGTGAAPGPAAALSTASGYDPQPYEKIRDGGTLTTAINEISAQFNVWHGDQTLYTTQVWNWYNPVLMTFDADGTAAPNPDYLSDVKAELVDGDTKITYTVNPKASFNDGTPIDWRAFEASWKVANGKDPIYSPHSTDGYDRITSVARGTDDKQAIVTFDGVNLWWQALFGSLLHPAALDPEVFNKGYLNSPHDEWGAGPYHVKSFDRQNGSIAFERNPKWWGKPGKLDTRTFLQMDATASMNAFRNGQLDAVLATNKDRYTQVKDLPGVEIRRAPSLQVRLFTLNGQSPLLSDPGVRRAIFEGIDRTQLTRIHFNGLDYDAPPPGEIQVLPFVEGYSDAVSKVITYAPDKARAELDAAGWVPGPDGIRAKDGRSLTLDYVYFGDDAAIKAVAGATAAMLKGIGVQLEIRQLPSSDFTKIIVGREFDMLNSSVTQTDPFGISNICQTYCSTSTLIRSGVNAPANDALMKAVTTYPTAQEQYVKHAEAEVVGLSTYGVLPFVNIVEIWAAKKGLANFGASRFYLTSPENIGWEK